MSEIRLDDKTAVVTGAGRGLGRAYAQALARAGASVVVNDIDADAATNVASDIVTAGGVATAVPGAVGETDTAQMLVDRALERYGRLDVLVTNAGVLRDGVLWKMSDDSFDLVIKTHLRGTFTCSRAAAITMRERGDGGRIIVIGSPAGQFGNFGQTNYAAAKAGIVAFARTWALELARSAITVNAVIPTAWTDMTASIPAYEPLGRLLAAGQPFPESVRRDHALGDPGDCSPLVVFLASDGASGISGQAIGIGGDKLTLYSHPAELVAEFHAGGWSAEQIAEAWPEAFMAAQQASGIELPPLDIDIPNAR